MIKIHREGRLIVLITFLILLALIILSHLFLPYWINYLLAAISLLVMVLVLRFFRVPSRQPFLEDLTIVAPADGKVVVIEEMHQEEYLQASCRQVSIFMSIHNVHINYFPMGGKIAYQKYHPGRYFLARHPKSSTLNERNSVGIENPHGKILVRQIAGYVARRVRTYATEGKVCRQGEEMGFIKFGSRLDLFLPTNAQILVEPGQEVMGAITPIARLK